MNRSIEESNIEKMLIDTMWGHMVESGNLEKIERFSRKNARLRDFAFENSISEAIAVMNESTKSSNIPERLKRTAVRKLRDKVGSDIGGIEADEFDFGSVVDRPKRKRRISEDVSTTSTDSVTASKNDEEDINRLVKDVAISRGIASRSGMAQSKADREFENALMYREQEKTPLHNYSIRTVVREILVGDDDRSEKLPTELLYDYNTGATKLDYLNTTFKSVVNGVDVVCGMNIKEKDFIWLMSGRPQPFLIGEVVVTADMVRGNDFLNTYFGPYGKFKDNLFRADGTPRLKPSEASVMSEIDREVNVISAYPRIKIYATVISWDVINGEERLRKIDHDDFKGTDIKVVD